MAIITWRPREAAPTLAQSFAIDPALLQSRAAQEARRRGVLLAKSQALRGAESMLAWGRLLGWGIIFVSAIHIWESVSAIAPAGVAPLRLPDAVYHGAALLFTLLIDAAALYVSRANAIVALAGGPPSRWAAYFYALTALLNAAFVAGHAPALDAHARDQILGLLNALFVIILPASVPAGMVAVERSRRMLEVCRLSLLEEVATLRGLSQPAPARPPAVRPAADGPGQNAPQPVLDAPGQGAGAPTGEPLIGGRPQEYDVEALIAAFAPEGQPGQIFGPAEVRAALGCSETTAKRLLAAASERGQVARVSRGAYQIQSADPVGPHEGR
jgi:hypothetical protein